MYNSQINSLICKVVSALVTWAQQQYRMYHDHLATCLFTCSMCNVISFHAKCVFEMEVYLPCQGRGSIYHFNTSSICGVHLPAMSKSFFFEIGVPFYHFKECLVWRFKVLVELENHFKTCQEVFLMHFICSWL